MTPNWLKAYLVEAVGKNLCTKIGCTTCGAIKFRGGVLSALSMATGKPIQYFDRETNIEIARALAEIKPTDDPTRDVEDAVRYLLVELWSGMPLLDREIEVMIVGTWAGEILGQMKAHYETRVAERRACEAFEDPINVQKRREEKKRLSQEQHKKRLALKKVRDRHWREKLGKAD